MYQLPFTDQLTYTAVNMMEPEETALHVHVRYRSS